MLHEVRVYHRVLSAEEMAQHAIHRHFPFARATRARA